jgi:hypothetical protein
MTLVILLILALVAFIVAAVLAVSRLAHPYWPVAACLGLALWVGATLVQLT